MKNYGFINIFSALIILSCFIGCVGNRSFSKKDVRRAQKLIGIDIPNEYISTSHEYLLRNKAGYDSLRNHKIGNEVFPALVFDPHPKNFVGPEKMAIKNRNWQVDKTFNLPDNEMDIAFCSIPQLAHLLQSGQITSKKLTQLYIQRIKTYNPVLECAITIIEKEALAQAEKADQEMRSGNIKSILHGIPYGVKDLMAVEGYPTTWGAEPYRDQMIDYTATVVNKLNNAGAILIAKLTSGALARGDVWFGGKTKNPWDTEQGASGSSAGSGSATAAGLVGFSLGTETLGSITSPSTRNGVSGLRTTYGVVSRHGVMSLSWSMDKVGPICRSAEDCAIVFDFIRGPSEEDKSIPSYLYKGIEPIDFSKVKIGIFSDLVEKDTSESGDNLRENIQLLKDLGCSFTTIQLPKGFPSAGYDIILRAEAGAFFDELVRSGRVDKMVEQHGRSRANSLRQARFIPAVEYIQANRSRSLLIEEMHQTMSPFDVVITPTFGGSQLMFTNLSGHPVITVPSGLDKKGHPTSISFLGNLYQESKILSFAHAYQKHSTFHKKRPTDFME